MLKDNIKQITVKSAISNYIGKTITTIVDAVLFILITKRLTVSDYGVYSFLIAILTFLAFFASLGIPYTLLRFIPEYIQKDKKDTAIYLIKVSFSVIAVLGVLLLTLSLFSAEKISFIFKITSFKRLLPLLVFIGMIYITIRAEEEILNALFMQAFRNICQVLASTLKLFLFISILQYRLDIDWLLSAIAAVSVLQSLLYYRKICIYFSGIKLQKKPPGSEIRRFWIFSVKEYLYVASAFFWDISFDIYIIAYLLGSVSTGFFNFASSISFFLLYWSPGTVLQSILSPLFVREYSKHNNLLLLNNLFRFYNKLEAFFAFPVILGIWLLADKFDMIIYQNRYMSAVSTLKILVLSVMIQAFTIPIKNIFNVFEKNEFALYSNVVIIYRVCASVILIKQFGVVGAAYAYGSSMLFYLLIYLFLVKRIIKITYPIESFLKILFNSLTMTLFLIILKQFMRDSLIWLFILIISGILIYLFLSYINKPFKKEERDFINEGLGIPAWHF